MIECYSCSAVYTIEFEDDDYSAQFCPSCGKDFDEVDEEFININFPDEED